MGAGRTGFSVRFLTLLAALIVLKLLIVTWAVPVLGANTEHYAIGHSPDRYDVLAANVANGIGYRIFEDTNVTMLREPGYVLVLASIFRVFGEHPQAARAANVLFSVVSVMLLFGIGRLSGIGDTAIRTGAVLTLCHPALIFAESRLGVETLLSLLMVATLYTMLRAQTSRTMGAFALAGLTAALTALTRSAVIPVFGLAAVWFLIAARRDGWLKGAARGLIVSCVCFLTVFSIWPLRNYVLSGQPVVSATVAGDAWYFGMYLSKHDGAGKEYHKIISDASAAAAAELRAAGVPVQRDEFTQLHASVDDELRHQSVLTAAALRAYRAEPRLWVRTVLRNISAFWIQGRTRLATSLNTVLFVGTALLFLPALFLSMRSGYRIALVPLFIVAYQAIHLPILAQARYHVVLIPLLMLLCGVALAHARRLYSGRGSG